MRLLTYRDPSGRLAAQHPDTWSTSFTDEGGIQFVNGGAAQGAITVSLIDGPFGLGPPETCSLADFAATRKDAGSGRTWTGVAGGLMVMVSYFFDPSRAAEEAAEAESILSSLRFSSCPGAPERPKGFWRRLFGG